MKNYGIADGLEGSLIRSYYQDSLGLIWMGANNALSYFDGQNFVNYTQPTELFSRSILDIDINEKGNLLLLTSERKTWEFNGINFVRHSFNNEEIDTASILTIQNFDGKLFIGTDNGLYIKKNNKISKVDNLNGPVINIDTDNHKSLYIISKEQGVFQYTHDSLKLVSTNTEINHQNFIKHQKGDFWSSTPNDGLFIKKEEQWDHVFGDNQLPIYEIAEDQSTTVWVATYIGLFRIIDNYYRQLYTFQEIYDETIEQIFIDRSNNIWASSFGKGVYKLTKNPFTNLKYPSSFPGEWAQVIFKDNAGAVWIKAANYGMLKFHNGQLKHYPVYNTFSNNMHCAIDLDTCILFGGNNITLTFKDEQFETFTKDTEERELGFHGFIKHQNTLYALIDYTIWQLKDNKWIKTNYLEGHIEVRQIFNDKNQTFWIATKNGLFKIHNNKAIAFESKELKANLEIHVIRNGHENSIWVGTNNGLFNIKNDSIIQHLTVKNGIPNNEILDLKINNDEIYIGTRTGFGIYSNGACKNYTSKDGLISDFIFPKGIEEVDGKVILCGGSGLSFFNKYYDNIDTPTVILSEIITTQDTIQNNILHPKLNEKIIFSTNTKNIQYKYIVVNQKKNLNKFRFKLNDQLIYTNTPNLELSNIKYGSYILNFEILNSLGIWEVMDTQSFKIKRVWYLSYTAIFIYFLLAILTSLYFFQQNRAKVNVKYTSSSLSNKKYQEIKSSIDKLLNEDKIYYNPDISLNIIAEKLNCNKEYISQVINTEHKQNFNSIINKYRVEEAKKLLVNKNGDFNSILEIGFEVGFNSKSAFNNAFKKFTNYTPSEFRKKYNKN